MRLILGLLSASAGTHAVAVCMCCAHDTCRLVCAFLLQVPRTRSPQRPRTHRFNIAGKSWCAQAKNLILWRQSCRPRSGLQKPLLGKTSQLWTPAACTRLSQRLSVNRFVMGAIVGKPCRRSVARHLARQFETFVSELAASSVHFGSTAVVHIAPHLGACCHPET